MTTPSQPAPAVRLTGWGRYAPAQVLTNADLERMVDTSRGGSSPTASASGASRRP